MAQQLAWLGLGNMGRGMCKNLVEKGNLSKPLIIFNRTQKRADDLSEKLGAGKTKVGSSVDDAVSRSDIIFTCLGDDSSINDVIATAMQSDVKGKLFVDCSTVHPDTTKTLNKIVTGKGARFVACPVFGAPAMAEGGQLVTVLAGPKEDVDQVKPYTKGVMGRADIDYSGQAPENASLMKVIGNTFILQMVEALSEGHTVAEKCGLGTDNIHAFLELMMPGPYVAYSTRMRQGDYYKREEPLFQVDLAIKDANHALNLATASGAKMNSVEVAKKHLQDVKAHAGEKGDIAGIYGAVRQESGLKYEN
ncbi:MAG: hypothetical protein M1828_006610 [Chrysothrix sp. TS-e1954]|nr:MAG: hypothetical protein M1828_006610 [Chrysothrix sp. TS-e1954]